MERAGPEFEPLEGFAPFATKAIELVSTARMELALLTQELSERIYSTEHFVGAVRQFVLQHSRARFRILINDPRRAIAGGSRMVEFGRRMSSYIEFRELLPERREAVREEYLVADGRLMLHREAPENLTAKYYGTTPHLARLKLKDFNTLWNESSTAQELRQLGI